MRRTAASVAALSALLSCGGPTVPAEAVPQLVLHPSDLPRGFVRFDWGPIGRRETRPGLTEDPPGGDQRGGWKARYRRSGGESAPGPLVVTSFVVSFGSEDAAAADLGAYRAALRTEVAQGSGEVLMIDGLGEEGTGSTFVQQALEPVRYFTIAWRRANVVASISVSGVDLTLDDALALARKQDRRIGAVG